MSSTGCDWRGRPTIPITDAAAELDDFIIEDFIHGLLLGDKIGEGIARTTYEYALDDTLVVKIETRKSIVGPDFQNIAEWELYTSAKPGLRKWMAPVVALSRHGTVLIAKRCEPCPVHLIPKKVPAIFDDTHDGNFGIYEGRPVLMDYGRNLALTMTANARTMRSLRP